MNAGRRSKNRRWGGLAFALLGVIGALYFGAAARQATLDSAIRQAAHGLTPALSAEAGVDPQIVVHRLVTTNASDMAFLTVRNSNDRLVASDGAWSSWFAGMASRATVRAWRAWMYRTLCAETYRTIPGGAQLHAGVPWWRVLARAGPAFWLMLLLTGLGLALFERARRRPPEAASSAPEPTAVPARRRRGWLVPAWRGSLQRIGGAVRRRDPLDSVASTQPAAGFEPIGQRRSARVSEATESARPMESGAGSAATPRNTAAEVKQPAPVRDAARAAPASGSSTASSALDRVELRFHPIWRGAMDGLLTGAAVGFTRPGDSTDRTLDLQALADTGTATPERIVPWLLRRLVTLQANWRTVELPRVPLVVSLPESLFAFEDADEVWAEALSSDEPAAGELVFCVERQPDLGGDALPVRWAVAEPRESGDATAYRLITSPHPDLEDDDVQEASRFVLPDDPAAQHTQSPLAPRTFARLMSRSELAPL